jgi:hypothetical protein
MPDSGIQGLFLPEEVQQLFDGTSLEERFGLAYELATVDSNGQPRIAMLSHGEVLIVDGRLRMALWPGSKTSANLAGGRSCLLSIVVPGSVWYLLGHARSLPGDAPLACFELAVEEVRADRHTGYPVTGPITYKTEGELSDAISDWRVQHDMLRH